VAKKSAGTSKSASIRSYKAAHQSAGPTEIAAALTKEGTKVSAAFVSTVLSNARRKGGKGRRKSMRHVTRTAADPIRSLVMAKKLADQMGGIDKARTALDALARILG
jgi:hypothetical protein